MSLVHPDRCDVCGRMPSHDCGYSLRQGRLEGAAVAFGIIGMAEAIRQRCTCPPGKGANTTGYVLCWEDLCERCKGYW